MSETTTVAEGAAAPATTIAPVTDTHAAAQASAISMSQEALNERLAQAKRSATTEFIKSLGVENADAIKTAIAKAKDLEEASKTEIQRLTDRVTALDPQAKLAADLQLRLGKYADAELAKLTDTQRTAVLALSGEDRGRALEAIEALRPTWAMVATSNEALKSPIAAPANTASSATPPAPASTITVDHKAQYKALMDRTSTNHNPTLAAAYLLTYPDAHPEHN